LELEEYHIWYVCLGASYAKLIARRSKGMPVISISLAKLEDAAAHDAMANLSLELYKESKSMHNLFKNGGWFAPER